MNGIAFFFSVFGNQKLKKNFQSHGGRQSLVVFGHLRLFLVIPPEWNNIFFFFSFFGNQKIKKNVQSHGGRQSLEVFGHPRSFCMGGRLL
jgi:hypothetical protein